MSAELYIFTKPKCWIVDNFNLVTSFFEDLNSFKKESDSIYLLIDQNMGEKEMPCVIFRFNQLTCEVMMEINAHPKDIENDLLKLFAEIKKHANLLIRDEDGEISNWCL
ncbi:hypothetical protein [Neisseria animaloris]|uniref:Uncharacterized protein n=1 Tax=Neisseria animaloris TaxID=326522 RepID=A0A3S5F6F6_9NEIS|nr:hypothetical protein [Neisseria animaloris]VEJ20722.1 Uncharacterised protein [Neisseria animaloris]